MYNVVALWTTLYDRYIQCNASEFNALINPWLPVSNALKITVHHTYVHIRYGIWLFLHTVFSELFVKIEFGFLSCTELCCHCGCGVLLKKYWDIEMYFAILVQCLLCIASWTTMSTWTTVCYKQSRYNVHFCNVHNLHFAMFTSSICNRNVCYIQHPERWCRPEPPYVTQCVTNKGMFPLWRKVHSSWVIAWPLGKGSIWTFPMGLLWKCTVEKIIQFEDSCENTQWGKSSIRSWLIGWPLGKGSMCNLSNSFLKQTNIYVWLLCL